jgi:hypothetical protein
MKRTMAKALIVAALACGAVTVTTGTASADSPSPTAVYTPNPNTAVLDALPKHPKMVGILAWVRRSYSN